MNGTLDGKRWNDNVENRKDGKFDEKEVELLIHSVCNYAKEKNLDLE